MITDQDLARAYFEVRRCAGANTPGVDGVTCSGVERRGVGEFLRNLKTAIDTGRYDSLPLRVATLPKLDGTTREIAVPTIRDRVVARVLAGVVTGRFSPELKNCFAFTAHTGVHDAINELCDFVDAFDGLEFSVVKLDIARFFPSIDRDLLLQEVSVRVPERVLRRLLRKHMHFRTSAGEPTTGLAQGSPLSPVLSNLFLCRIDTAFNALFTDGTFYVRYADDIVLVVKGNVAAATARADELATALLKRGLTINEAKTVVVRRGEHVDFLGHRIHLPGGGLPLWMSVPPRAQESLRRRLNEIAENLPLNASVVAALWMMRRASQGWLSFFERCAGADVAVRLATDAALETFLTSRQNTGALIRNETS